MTPEIKFFQAVHVIRDFPAAGLPEICISGRSNVGKSSLINCLAGRRNLARISQNPGKTQSLNYYAVGGAWYLVDLPGYGYVKVSKAKRRIFAELMNPYLNNRQELTGIIQLIDSRHGPVGGDYDMLEWLQEWDGEVLYVLTKADKLSGNGRIKVMKNSEKMFGTDNIILFSARTGMGRDSVNSWIDTILGLKGS